MRENRAKAALVTGLVALLLAGLTFGIHASDRGAAGSQGEIQLAQAEGKKAAASDEKEKASKKGKVSKFMREKLAASNEVLEGLAVEDFNLILQGANKLAKVSEAEEWQVSTDSMYRQHSNEFGRAVKQLQTAAKDRKLDAAALAWLDATMDCIECHRWVRAMLIAN